MNIEDIDREVNERLEALIEAMVARKAAELASDPEALAESVMRTQSFNRLINDRIQRGVANEIQNRLRCGIYDGFQMDKIFASIWTTEFDRAMRERAQAAAMTGVRDAVKAHLENLRQGT